jgi:hypothetical protein
VPDEIATETYELHGRRLYIRGMKVIAFDRFKPGVTMETIQPYLKEEVANVWRLWKAGVVRENYARADEPGVIIVFEVESVEEARRYVADFALSKAGYLDWEYLPVQAPLPLEALMDPSVDVAEPYDRTSRAAPASAASAVSSQKPAGGTR